MNAEMEWIERYARQLPYTPEPVPATTARLPLPRLRNQSEIDFRGFTPTNNRFACVNTYSALLCSLC